MRTSGEPEHESPRHSSPLQPFLVAVGLLSHLGVQDGHALVGVGLSTRLPRRTQELAARKPKVQPPDWTRALSDRLKQVSSQGWIFTAACFMET